MQKHITRSRIAAGLFMRLAAVAVLGFVFFTCAHAQNIFDAHARTNNEVFEATLYFRVADTRLEPGFMHNDAVLSDIDAILGSPGAHRVVSVSILGNASPEGDPDRNVSLARGRSRTLSRYLAQKYPFLAGNMRIEEPAVPESASNDQYPYLRTARILLRFSPAPEKLAVPVYSCPELLPRPAVETLMEKPQKADTIRFIGPVPPVVPVREVRKNTVLAAKTNLLFDALTALNVEVEVPISDRISLLAEDVFPWWETGNKYCFQMWEMGAEARYWFKPWEKVGTEKLRGWFAGLYGMSAIYDFQLDRSLNYQGEYWSAGITGGYALPIGRKKRVNLEFSLGLGYLQTQYRHYMPTENYDKLIRDRYHDGKASYWGPTKAKISLVIPINFNTQAKEVRHD